MKTTRKDMLKTAAAAIAVSFLPLASKASISSIEDQCIKDWAAFHARWFASCILDEEVYNDNGRLHHSSLPVCYVFLPFIDRDKGLCAVKFFIEIPAKTRRVYVSSVDTPAEVWRPELKAQLKKFLAEEAHKTLKHLEHVDFTVWPEAKKILDWTK